jgi:hypothetical protein
MKEAIVVLGCVETTVNNAPAGSGGRALERRRLFTVGERVTLPTAEAARLAKLGVVKLVA